MHFLIIILFTVLMSCQDNSHTIDAEKPIARVGNRYLYASDIKGIGSGLTKEDSLYQVNIQIDQWIRDKLMEQVAERNIASSSEIERMVMDYRASLIMSSYETALLNQRLDKEITPQQLSEYYNNNIEQYQSGLSWIRCLFVKAEKNSEDVNQLRKWFKSENGVDFERIKLFCAQNQTTHMLNEGLWIKLKTLKQHIPSSMITNRHLKEGRILDQTDEDFIYLLQVFEYRDKDEATPLPQVKDEIARILLHQRKNNIMRQIRDDIYADAKSKNQFEIY